MTPGVSQPPLQPPEGDAAPMGAPWVKRGEKGEEGGAQRGAGDSGSGAKSSRYRGGKAASGAAGRRRRKVCSCSTC